MLSIFRWGALIAAIVLIVALAGVVVSSQPPLGPTQQQASEKHYGEEHNEKSNITLWDRWFPDTTAIFNLFLVVFTGVLAFVGIFQLNALNRAERISVTSAQAAKKAADAAQQSADAIANIERPYLFVSAKPSKISAKDGPADLNPTISYSFLNLGRVPAVIRLIYAQCFLAQQLSPTPTYSQRKFKITQSAIGPGGTLTELPVCEMEESLTSDDWADIKADKKGIVFTAIVLYEGALDYTYSTIITYKIDPFTGHAFSIGGPSYNNEQSERGRVIHGAPIPLPNIVP